MNAFIVTYNLDNNETSYPLISKKLKSYGKWAKPFERTWIIKTDKSAVEVRDELASSIHNNGSILVMNVSGVAWATSRVNTKVNDWLHGNV